MSGQRSLEPSTTVDERQVELAREEGEAYQQSAQYVLQEVAHDGSRTEVGDYVVGVAQQEAQGAYGMHNDQIQWHRPDEDENCYLAVLVAEVDTGRFLPHLDVTATLEDADGNVVGPVELPFAWHPSAFHYGGNLELPGDGAYTVVVDVGVPTFARHDEVNGVRFEEGAEVVFEGVDVETGQE